MLNMSLLVICLTRRLPALAWKSIGQSMMRSMVATLAVALVCAVVALLDLWSHPGDWTVKGVVLFTGIGVSIAGYLGGHAMLGSSEMKVLWSMARRKLGWKA
jgi:O-antigen ligase